MGRKKPNMHEKLAATLLCYWAAKGEPLDREQAKMLSAKEICALVHFDHDAGFACHGKDNHPTGLTPRIIPEHWEKTRKIDQPAIAKCARIAKDHAEHRAKILAKVRGEVEEVMQGKKRKPKAKIANRGFPTPEQRRTLKEKYAR